MRPPEPIRHLGEIDGRPVTLGGPDPSHAEVALVTRAQVLVHQRDKALVQLAETRGLLRFLVVLLLIIFVGFLLGRSGT